jgi:hypothetical protein
MPDWFWQGLLTNWVSAAVIFVGGIMLAFLKARGSKFTSPLLYGLGGAVLLTALALMINIGGELPPRKPTISSANAEQNVRSWVEKFGFSVRNEQSDQAVFLLHLTGVSGTHVDISESRRLNEDNLMQTLDEIEVM